MFTENIKVFCFLHNLSYVNVPSVILFFPPTPHPTQHHLVHHCIQLLRFGSARNRGCGKAMFSQSSVSHSVPRGEVGMSGPRSLPGVGGGRYLWPQAHFGGGRFTGGARYPGGG